MNRLHVYRVPLKYINQQIPLDESAKDNADTQWLTKGAHGVNVPIYYGVVPDGMKETTHAKPLAEGEIYLATILIATEETGALVGQYFRVQGGRTIQVNEPVDGKTLRD